MQAGFKSNRLDSWQGANGYCFEIPWDAPCPPDHQCGTLPDYQPFECPGNNLYFPFNTSATLCTFVCKPAR